jgi:hypothetical protein
MCLACMRKYVSNELQDMSIAEKIWIQGTLYVKWNYQKRVIKRITTPYGILVVYVC